MASRKPDRLSVEKTDRVTRDEFCISMLMVKTMGDLKSIFKTMGNPVKITVNSVKTVVLRGYTSIRNR